MSRPPALPQPDVEDGWFGETANARLPETCPTGLVATNTIGHAEAGDDGDWTYFCNIDEQISSVVPQPLDQPVVIPVSQLANAARLAWFANTYAAPDVRISLNGMPTKIAAVLPRQVVAVPDGDATRVGFGYELTTRQMLDALHSLAAKLSALPDGTTLEISSAPMAADFDDEEGSEAGLQRYRGTLTNGQWHIASAYPAIPSATLLQALALAHEASTLNTIQLVDATEGEAAIKRYEAIYGDEAIQEYKPRIADGVIKLKTHDPGLLLLLGAALFALRFHDHWPVRIVDA